ncbi:helix-turn-helix transcriptional regulator, partial [Nocardia sp. NPDC004722]
RGIPGMRPAPSRPGHILLRYVSTTAAVEFGLPGEFRLPEVKLRRGHALWRDAPDREHSAEASEIELWSNPISIDPVARDYLFSRLLRRPKLTSLIATRHGLANTYSRGDRDLVIEWCCGAKESEAISVLEQSGLTSPAPELATFPIEAAQPLTLGDVPIHLRRVSCYVPPTYVEDLLDAYRWNLPLSSIEPLHTDGVTAGEALHQRRQILAYLRGNYTDPDLTVDVIAQACLVTRQTLYRVCESIGGPGLLVRRMRVEHARRIIRSDPTRPLPEVAAASGFATDRHFYRAFREETGLTPGQFRTQVEADSPPVE